eukprot:GDKI01037070.1.p1 GENE.GDKI01037070.1~~GDKI01037070.1.p1  ORF type:complete len:147 (-),score=39.72 GDKI01037070.1:76-516(-)
MAQITDEQWSTLPRDLKQWAQEEAVELLNRFRKMTVVSKNKGPERVMLEFQESLKGELNDLRGATDQAERDLRNKITEYTMTAQKEQESLSKYILFLESALDHKQAERDQLRKTYERLKEEAKGLLTDNTHNGGGKGGDVHPSAFL